MRHVKFTLCLLSLSCAFAAAPTANQNSLPITVTSDTATVDLNAGTAVYNGNVIANQGTRKLTGNALTITRGNNGNIQSFMAQGNPATTQEKPSADATIATGQAKTIYYLPEQNLVKYVNQAKFTQGGNVFTGDLITYNTATQIVSAPKTKSGTGTTTIIIPPYSQNKAGAS